MADRVVVPDAPATPEGRPLPAGFFDRYAHLEEGRRPAGGIVVPGTVLKAPLEAE